MTNFSTKEKLTILAILTAIMEADEVIHPAESAMLGKVLSYFDLRDSITDILDDYDLNLAILEFKQFSAEKQQDAINLFREMASCDGFIDPRESEIINSLELHNI